MFDGHAEESHCRRVWLVHRPILCGGFPLIGIDVSGWASYIDLRWNYSGNVGTIRRYSEFVPSYGGVEKFKE